MTNPETQYRQSPQADATMAGDRAAIYHRESRKAITLNPAGTILWQELAQSTSRTSLVARLQTQWPQLDDATAGADVDKFLEQLKSHDLVIEE